MKRFLFPLFLLIIVSCNDRPVSEKKENGFPGRKGGLHLREQGGRHERFRGNNGFRRNDTVKIADASVSAAIKTNTVRTQEYSNELTVFGVVKPVPGNYAEVSVPFDGRIIKSNVRLGQKVYAGTPLFELFSPDYLESVRTFLEARREKEIKEINYKRKKDLFDSEIISEKEYEEARLELDLADKEFEKSLELLKIYSQDTDNVDISRPFNVVSPISGEIVRNEITVGQFLRTDTEPVIVVANLEKVRIVANVKERDLDMLSLEDEVWVRTESNPDRHINGKIVYISDIMNEQTRSVEVYVECNNIDKFLKSGMYVTVSFNHRLKGVIIVPSKAVYQDSDRCYLFIQSDVGAFVRREISVRAVGNNQLMVRSGLEDGNVIVTDGGLFLR